VVNTSPTYPSRYASGFPPLVESAVAGRPKQCQPRKRRERGDDSGVSERDRRERLSVPPHDPEDDLRLASRTEVYGDITVEKDDGSRGQNG